jgi:cyclic beta-1,2-glucan synthetase
VLALVRYLEPFGADVRPVVEWLERRLASREQTLQDITRVESQYQVGVGNAVASLRWTADVRWGALIEAVSLIEHRLRADPAGVYRRMDFETRDRYRRAVERLARHAGRDEVTVAETVVERARAAPEGVHPSIDARHVGHHLIGDGLAALERDLGSRPPLRRRLGRFAQRHPGPLYLGVILSVMMLALAGALAAVSQEFHPSLLVIGFLAAVLPILDLAVAVANRLIAWIVPPRRLPKLDADDGLDVGHRALVVIPTLMRSPADAVALVEQLEIQARANPSSRLRFALLTDFLDADARELPGDQGTLASARDAIRALNDAERDEWGDRFFLLHRERRWNPSDGTWMGWERKRGKLEELNRLLRSRDAETSFVLIEGDLGAVIAAGGIPYVLTLDADTRLPPGAAIDLIRTAAHPLNQPLFDPAAGRVVRGDRHKPPPRGIAPRGARPGPVARKKYRHPRNKTNTPPRTKLKHDQIREGRKNRKGH